MVEVKALTKLAKTLYNNTEFEYNGVSGDEAMRNIVKEAIGGEFNYYNWQRHKYDVFEIMKTTIDAVVPQIITNQFDSLADVRSVATGDKPHFEVEDPRLLRVGLVSAGNTDTRRQTIGKKSFTVDTDWYDVKVYAEFEAFLAGNINWRSLCDRVAKSFTNAMGTQIYTSFQAGYDLLRTNVKATGAFELEQLINIAEHLRVQTGRDVDVYGTANALRQVTKVANMSDGMKDEANRVGYLATVAGLNLNVLPQAYKASTEEFALNDKSLLVLPKGEKIVSIVLEGQAIVDEPDNMTRNDMQLGFQTQKKYGLQVAQLAHYGLYNIA